MSPSTLPPTDLPFRDGDLPEGAVHHFLLPAIGWGAVAGEKEAKQLAPDDTARLAAWRRAICRKPAKGRQTQRLQALAGRVEFLWQLVIRRLEISEREVARYIDVWGADGLNHPLQAVPRQKVYADLHAEGFPYWRLRTLMNTWCALWFWPLHQADLLDGSSPVYEQSHYAAQHSAAINQRTIPEPVLSSAELINAPEARVDLFGDIEPIRPGTRELRARSSPKSSRRPVIALTDLNDWLDFAESLLGSHDLGEDTLFGKITTLDELDKIETRLPVPMGMDSPLKLVERFPWLTVATQIADHQGFFPWELDFAHIFASPAAGFDLQLGNPPWVRPTWDEADVLAELDPWFKLVNAPPVDVWVARKSSALPQKSEQISFFLNEFTDQVGMAAYLSSATTYPLIAGTQPNLYRLFMVRAWANLASHGVAGLIHPDTHFGGDKEGPLRAAAYRYLRFHAHFSNLRGLFPDVRVTRQFGLNIYSTVSAIGFTHASWLFDPETLLDSLTHSGLGDNPGIKFNGQWDLRPHRSRLLYVDEDLLVQWRRLFGEIEGPLEQTPLLYPVTIAEKNAIAALSASQRLDSFKPRISPGLHEKGDKDSGIIRSELNQPSHWNEVILRGPHFGVATPFAKQAPDMGRSGKLQDLVQLASGSIPATDYVRSCDLDRFRAAHDFWVDHDRLADLRASQSAIGAAQAELEAAIGARPDAVAVDTYLHQLASKPDAEFYRLAWREMISFDTERSLFAAIVPPGASHVHAVKSMALRNNRETIVNAGFWSTIVLDYLLRITGRAHLGVSEARIMPAPSVEHPLIVPVILRTLRLNCLTSAYGSLWKELYEDSWCDEQWAVQWPGLRPLGLIDSVWSPDTPLRSEHARRAALVELDALVAVWLDIDIEELVAVLNSRYAIMLDYEMKSWFDAYGRKIAGNHNTYGHGQTKEHFKQLMTHLEKETAPPEGYLPPFYKADRVGEMRRAHEVFSRRLAEAPGWARG